MRAMKGDTRSLDYGSYDYSRVPIVRVVGLPISPYYLWEHHC